jgi:hypothetical protein
MPRFLVEVSQPADRAVRRLRGSVRALGSHFATHSDWRQRDGRCIGSMVVEVEDWHQALAVVPPAMRPDAQVYELQAMAA